LAGYAALSLACILLTSSRSAFVGLIVLLLLVAALSKHRLKWLLLLALAAPVGWQVLPKDRQNRFLTLIDPSYGPENARESAEGRSKGLRDGLRIWNEHPLLGIGPGAFGEASGGGYESHQLYGQVLGELGGLGAVAFVGILAAFAYNALVAYRLGRKQPELREGLAFSAVWAVSLTVLLLLLMGFGGHNLYRYTWLWFGAFQAIALDCMRRQACETIEEAIDCELAWSVG
jgi:O-antigen ligase